MFDSWNEVFWCTDHSAKNQNSFRWTNIKKIRLDHQRGKKNCPFLFFLFFSFNWTSNWKFHLHWTQWINTLHISLKTHYEDGQYYKNGKKGPIFLDPSDVQIVCSFKLVDWTEFWFFALWTVHQDATFELTNNNLQWFKCFIFIGGEP